MKRYKVVNQDKVSDVDGKNFRAIDELRKLHLVKGYEELIQSEEPSEINRRFVDLRPYDNISILAVTDPHISSPSVHFNKINNAFLIMKYVPQIYGFINGDFINNENGSSKCKSSPMEGLLTPSTQYKLYNAFLSDQMVMKKVLGINSGNHENGDRTADFGVDVVSSLLSNTENEDKYSRYSTLLTIRLKANNKQGFEDIPVYFDHGNALKGDDGKAMERGMSLASKYGARVAVFGHIHKDIVADFRRRSIIDHKNGSAVYNDMTVIELPAPMNSDLYALDKRYETLPNDIKLINIGTLEKNPYLLGATQKERKSILPTQVYCDVVPIPEAIWKFANSESARLESEIATMEAKSEEVVDGNISEFIEKLSTDFDNGDKGMGE